MSPARVSEREADRKLEQMRALDNGMRIVVVRVDTVPLGVDTPPNSKPPADAEEDLMPLKIAYQGEPGANSHIACLEVYPDLRAAALRHLRGCLPGGEGWRGGSWR